MANLFSVPAASPFFKGSSNELYFSAQQDFGFVGDFISTGENPPSGTVTVMTSGQPTLTMTNAAPFQAGRDEGKRILVQGAGAAGAVLVSTILSVSSASVCTLANNASTTVTANSVGPVIVGASFGTDNTAAITRMTTAVNTTYAAFPSLRITFGQSATNAYGFPTTVLFNKTVCIEGIAGGYTSDVGDGTRVGGTRLAWFGTSSDGGTAFQAFFTCAPTGVQSLKRTSFRHAWIDCSPIAQNQALIGLKLSSCQGFQIEDFYISNALAQGLYLGIGTTPTEAKDTTRFTIKDLCSRQLDNSFLNVPVTTPFLMTSAVTLTQTPQSLTVAANSLPTSGYLWTATTSGTPVLVNYTGGGGTTTLTGCTIALEDVVLTPATVNGGNIVQATPGNACSIYMSGGSAANTCCGMMQMLQISYGTTWGPAALEFLNSDSVLILQPMMNGGNNTNDGAINRVRKPGIRMAGSIVSATLAARNNIIQDGDPGAGGISIMGVLNTGSRMTAPSGPHDWRAMQLGNGAPLPTIESGGILDWSGNGSLNPGYRVNVPVADQSIAAATATLITGSLIPVPPQGFQIGTRIRWKMQGQGGAAGTTAGHVFNIRLGTGGVVGDASVAAFTTTTTPTAVISQVTIEIELTIRTLGAAATATAQCNISNAGAAGTAVGFLGTSQLTVIGTMSTFNSTTANQFWSASLTTAAAKTFTMQQCSVEILNPGNNQ
jgi:hypothetical protein